MKVFIPKYLTILVNLVTRKNSSAEDWKCLALCHIDLLVKHGYNQGLFLVKKTLA